MLIKTKVKTYPDGSAVAYVYRNPYLEGVVNPRKCGINGSDRTSEEIEADRNHSAYMNLVRTRSKIKDYCLSNNFNYFWVLTFADKRDSDEAAFKRLGNWLKYMKRKYGAFQYIFIPERHKDGCIHFHGVTSGFKGILVDSGVKVKGVTIYNCENWNYGYSTVSEIRDKKRSASYITKYITKQFGDGIVEKGKKKYWCSRGLRLPVEKTLNYNPYDGLPADWENDNVQIYNIK